jgi:hypothetical protein
MIPILMSWSRKAGLAPGHLMMPLSFASILGGTVTLIGTSTNLVVAGAQKKKFPDDPPLKLFDLTPYGVPVAIVGVIYIVLLAPTLLPGKAKNTTKCAHSDDHAMPVALRMNAMSLTAASATLRACQHDVCKRQVVWCLQSVDQAYDGIVHSLRRDCAFCGILSRCSITEMFKACLPGSFSSSPPGSWHLDCVV